MEHDMDREKAQEIADNFNRAQDVVKPRKCKCGDVTIPGTSDCGEH